MSITAKPRPRRRWRRIAWRSAVVAVLLVAAAVPLVKFWLAPSLIRSAVTAAIGRRWDGPVALREVQFNFFAPIRLRGLCLDGPDGRRWAAVDEARAVLKNWPGTSPVLTAVEADRVRVDLHWAGGRLGLPIRPAPDGAEGVDAGKYVDLQRITVAAADLALHHGADDRTDMPTLGVSVVREGGRYVFRAAPLSGAQPSVEGYFDPAEGFRGRLKLTRDLTGAECALLAACAGVDAAGSGTLDADLTVAAKAGRLRAPTVEGKLRLRNWKLQAGGEPLCRDLSADMDLLGTSARLVRLTAKTPGGTIAAAGRTTLPLGRPLDYDIELTADEVPLALLRGLGERLPVTGGVARGSVRVRGGTETITLAGKAAFDAGKDLGPVRGAAGEAEFDASVTGPLNDPARLRVQGRCDLRRWTCRDGRGPLASADSMRVQFDGDRFTVPAFQLRLGKARLTAGASVTMPRADAPVQYQAVVRTDAPADLEELARRLAVDLPAGTAEVDVTARGSGSSELRLTGTCQADLRPGVWRIHKAGGTAKFDVAVTDPGHPSRAAVRGSAEVVGRVDAPGAALARKVSARVKLTGRSADISELVIDTPGGAVTGSARVAWPVGGAPAYTGSLQSAGLDPAPVAKACGLAGWRGQGRLAARAVLRGTTTGMTVAGDATLAADAEEYGLPRAEGPLAYDLKAVWAGDGRRGVTGTVRLKDFRLATAGGVDVKGLDGLVTISPDAIDVANVSGSTQWGRIETAAAHVELAPPAMRASASLKQWDLAAVVRHFRPGSLLRGGPADLDTTVTLDGGTLRVTAAGAASAGCGGLPLRGGGAIWADVTVAHVAEGARRVMTGKARLAGWGVEGSAGRVLEDLALTAAFDRRTIHITGLTARTARGRLAAAGRIDLPPAGPFRYAGTADVTGLDIPAAISLVRPASPVTSGDLAMAGSFSGQGGDTFALRARGACRLGGEIGPARQAGGAYAVDVHLAGPLADRDRLAVRGTGRLEDWQVRGDNGPIVEQVGVSLLMLGRSVDVSSFRGRLAGGRIVAHARLDAEPRTPIRYGGGVTLGDVDVARLAESLGRKGQGQLGLLQARYRFQGQGTNPDNLCGGGLAALGHSRPEEQAAMQAVLQRLGVVPAKAGRFDVRAAFVNRGPVVTIRHARLATPVLAMVVQDGSTADLRTRQMDLYVVGAMLHDIDRFFGKVPVLNLTGALTRKLSRLRVTGRWDDRKTLRIREEPLRNLSEGTIDFLRQAVHGGGRLGQDINESLRRLVP